MIMNKFFKRNLAFKPSSMTFILIFKIKRAQAHH